VLSITTTVPSMRLIYEQMATNDDITADCMFTVGSLVSCVTCFDTTVEGEVIAFDYTKRLLILKCTPTDGVSNHSDINCLNLEYVKDVTVKREVKREDVVNTQLPQINTTKVQDRYNRAVDERKRLVDAFNSGVDPDGIKLWLTLNKSLRDLGVVWEADSIIIDNSVRIVPPYKVDNCLAVKARGSPDGSVKQIKRLVDKYWADQKALAKSDNNYNN